MKTPVTGVMTAMQNALCAAPTDTIGMCLRLMNAKIFRHLPVVEWYGGNTTPLGVLKLRDLHQIMNLVIS